MVLNEGLKAKSEKVHVHFDKVLLKYHHTHALRIVYGCSCAQQQNGAVATETIRPSKPKLGTVLVFAKVCLPML